MPTLAQQLQDKIELANKLETMKGQCYRVCSACHKQTYKTLHSKQDSQAFQDTARCVQRYQHNIR